MQEYPEARLITLVLDYCIFYHFNS